MDLGRRRRFNDSRHLDPQTRQHKPDYWLLALSALLLSVGLIVIYSISPALSQTSSVGPNYFFNKQLLAIVLGIIVFGVVAFIPYTKWAKYTKWLLIAGALATLVALIMPVNPAYPAHRWIRLGGISFQSVELVTFALLIWLAKLLSERMSDGTLSDAKKTFKPLIIALLITGFVVAGIQSDLGSMMVIIIMMGMMVYVAGLPMKRIMLIAGVVAIGTLLAISSTPYRRARLTAFLHPTSNCQTTSGYQACQALISVGSGGLIGLGLGRSVQAYGYLPESANDSIFAIYAEKFGFIGSVVLIGIFSAFFVRCKRIIDLAPNNFTRLVGVGILTWLSVQTLINIGAMLGLLPLKGITLPFISYGGTSVVFTMAVVGVMFEISRYTLHTLPVGERVGERTQRYDNSFNGRRVRRPYNSAPSSRA